MNSRALTVIVTLVVVTGFATAGVGAAPSAGAGQATGVADTETRRTVASNPATPDGSYPSSALAADPNDTDRKGPPEGGVSGGGAAAGVEKISPADKPRNAGGSGVALTSHNNDFYEPNDLYETATYIERPRVIGNRTLQITADEAANGFRTDIDTFAITLQEGQQLDVDLSFDHSSGDINVVVYEDSEHGGDQVALGDSMDDGESVSVTAGYTGTYYVLVYGANDDTSNSYTMSVSRPTDSNEPPWAEIVNLSVPSEIEVGQSFTVLVAAENVGGPAGDFSTISVAFPRLEETDDGSQIAVVDTNFVAAREAVRGDNISTVYSTQRTADYALAEAGTGVDNGGWPSGETRYIQVEVTPEQTGTFPVEFRATLTDDDTTFEKYSNPPAYLYNFNPDNAPYPVDDLRRGQQRYTVAVRNVSVVDDTSDGNDRFESNDGFSSATPITEGAYGNLTIADGDSDVFAIELSAGDTLDVTALFDHSDADLDMTVYGPDQTIVADSASSSDNENVQITAETSGTYYIEVYEFDGAPAPYSLDVAVNEGTSDNDRFEPNDNPDEAASISEGAYSDLQVVDGEADFFAVELSEGQTLNTAAFFDHGTGDLDMVILDPDLNEVAQSFSDTDDEFASATAQQSGTYYVVVFGESGASAPYSLEVDIGETTTDDQIPDTFDSAVSVSEGSYGNLTITSGDSDFFAIELSAGDTLDVSALFDHSDADIDMAVYGPDRGFIADSISTSDNENIQITAETSGTYYIEVYEFSGAPAPYSLEVAVNEGTTTENDRFEPNDGPNEAAPISEGAYSDLQVLNGEQDWYAVELSEGQSLDAAAFFDHGTGNLELAILDPDLNVVSEGFTGTDDEFAEVTTEQSGTYYVVVFGAQSDTSAPYSLELSVGTAEDPSAAFSYSPSLPDVGETVTFNASGSTDNGAIQSYEWDFDGDGTVDATGEVVSHTFQEAGDHAVTLTVTDDDGNTDTVTRVIAVGGDDEVPNSFDSAMSITEGSYGNLTITNGDSDFFAIELSAGDTLDVTALFDHSDADIDMAVYGPDQNFIADSISTSDNENIQITAETSGTYYIEVYEFSGAPAPYSLDVAVNEGTTTENDRFEPNDDPSQAAPISEGTYTDLQVVDGELDFFAVELSEGQTLNTSVFFDHGTGDLELVLLNPDLNEVAQSFSDTDDEFAAATAQQSGTYYVVVLGDGGASAPYTLEVSVGTTDDPTAAFGYSPSAPTAGETVTFDASNSTDDGSIVSYEWDFNGDGAVDMTGERVDFAFPEAGDYAVTLIVTDDAGNTDTLTRIVSVGETGAPTASFRFSPSEPTAGETVTFDASRSTDDGTIERYEWDFDGDGIVDATGETVSHSFESAGEYDVTLTVTDDAGNTDSVTRTVSVGEAVQANHTVTLRPANVNVSNGGTVTLRLVFTNATAGIGAHDFINVSVSNTDVATVTDISTNVSSGATTRVASDGSEAAVRVSFGGDTPDTGTVTVATVTLRGQSVGSTRLSVTVTGDVAKETGKLYAGVATRGATLRVVESGPPALPGFANAPNNVDDDGQFEDVNGNGRFDIGDVQSLFVNRNSDVVANNVDAFDFNDNGRVDIGDIQSLFVEYQNR